ncbi:hypothetical protein U1Q18_039395 [Sarracenia purpurea var. burkii]
MNILPLPSLELLPLPSVTSAAVLTLNGDVRHTPAVDSAPITEMPPPPLLEPTVDSGKSIAVKTKKNKGKKKKRFLDDSETSSVCSTSHPTQKGIRVVNKQRSPRVLIGLARQKEGILRP